MFNTKLRDAQSTSVEGIAPEQFDIDEYAEYAAKVDEKVEKFMQADSGVLVYRKFRVAEVYGHECSDRELSLRLQLGALKQSMKFAADIPNFLEPWYGIGIGAAAFGAKYVWKDGQAPATPSIFADVEEALACDPVPIETTDIGREQLAYIEYFLDKTRGRLPMSLSDVQSPLNIVSEMIPTTELFMDILDDPDAYSELARRAGRMKSDFLVKQRDMIGDALVLPGHGFASSKKLIGLGQSADTSIMINNSLFDEVESPLMAEMGEPFGGTFYHSCGNWGKKVPVVLQISNLVGADGAFSSETDPSPNTPEDFGAAFAGTGKILNARAVGDPDTVVDTVKRLWHPGLKLIINTYCKTPEEQQEAYDRIHEICH